MQRSCAAELCSGVVQRSCAGGVVQRSCASGVVQGSFRCFAKLSSVVGSAGTCSPPAVLVVVVVRHRGGGASGYQLDTLLRLSDTKAPQHKETSLLHFLVKACTAQPGSPGLRHPQPSARLSFCCTPLYL